MSKSGISVTIITLNEEANIERAIGSVAWADEVIVVDSGSTDRTRELAKKLGARVYSNPWLGYGQQKNFAHEKAKEQWVLNIDADEVVTSELREEILSQITQGSTSGFKIPRKTWFLNRWIMHGGWYPNYLMRLAKKSDAKWTEPAIHEELLVRGVIENLKNPLLHYTFVDLKDQVTRNVRYAGLGADQLIASRARPSLVKLLLKPIGKFIETYFFKLGFLDGLPGFFISINASHSMFLKYARVFEKNWSQDHANTHH